MYFLQEPANSKSKKIHKQTNEGGEKKRKWSSKEPYMPQETTTTTTKQRFENALKYRDYKQLESSWLNSHSHFGLHRGRRTWSPLKVIPIPAPAAMEAIMMRNCDVSNKCKRIWKAKQTNKPTKKTKRAKHAGSLAQRLHDFKQQPRNQTSLPEPTSDLISGLLTNPTK